MATINELHEVMTTEAQLTENLITVLQQQQEAVIHSQAEALNRLLDKSEELLGPIEALEKERTRLAALMVWGNGDDSAKREKFVTASELLSRLTSDDASLIDAVTRRLQAASEEVLRINRMNKPLLDHSQYFIKQVLRAATDDYRKSIVDKRM
jgi:flagellar biosynthesis/type III secretory pathway chaperone